jgi:hypothetical protein
MGIVAGARYWIQGAPFEPRTRYLCIGPVHST